MSNIGLPPNMSLRDYEKMLRENEANQPPMQPVAPAVDVPADGGPVGYNNAELPKRNIDVGTKPYYERSLASRIIGAPLDLYETGVKKAGLVDPSYLQAGGSASLDRLFNLTTNEIISTPGDVSSLAGVGVAAAKAAGDYLTSDDADTTFGQEFEKQIFTEEGRKALDQKTADLAAGFKDLYPNINEAQLRDQIDQYYKTEEGYQFLTDQMIPLLREGRTISLATHKALGLRGTPDDRSYLDDATGIVGSSLVALPAAPAKLGGSLAEGVIDQAYQKFLRNKVARVALKTAEVLTPVTIPATKGTIAANAAVGLVTNDVLRNVTGQASISGGDFDSIVQQESNRLADGIEQTASAATGDVSNTDPVVAAGAGVGAIALAAAGLRGRGYGKAIYNLLSNSPVSSTQHQAVNAATSGLAATTTPISAATKPTVAQTIQAAAQATSPSVPKRAADLAANLVDESAPIRHAVREATRDPDFVTTVDALHQNLVAGGGRNLDASAVQTGVFSNGDRIGSVDWRKLNSDVEMLMRDPNTSKQFTDYSNMLQEVSVRKKAVDNYYKAYQEAITDLQANPKSLIRQQAVNNAYKDWLDSRNDASLVGRQDFLQLSDRDLRSAITQFEANPIFKDVSTRMAKVGDDLLGLRLRNGLITRDEYDVLKRYPYYLRKMADYSGQRSWLGNVGKKIENAVDYTKPKDFRGRGYAGLTSIDYEKGAEGEIKQFANPIDAMRIGVFELSKDLRHESFKRQVVDGLEARGVKIEKQVYNREKHGDLYNERAATKFLPMRDASTGRLIVAKMPHDLAWLMNRTPEVYSTAEQIGNFWRTFFQRGITGPIRGVSSIINQGMTAYLTPLALASAKVNYNPATIVKGLRYSLENGTRELLSGTALTVKSALLDTPLFRALNLLPNGPQAIDSFLTSIGERLKSNYMQTLEELGVNPTAMIQGLPTVGPNYVDQFKTISKAGNSALNPMSYSPAAKQAFETYARTFEQILSGPRLAVLDDQLNKLKRKHNTNDIYKVPDSELRTAIQRAREIEGDYMRNVGSPGLRKLLSLIPYGRITVQGNLIVLKRLSDALSPIAGTRPTIDNLTALSRLIGFGIMPKLVSIGLMAAAGKQTLNWYWSERTDQQRLREWHFPKKLEDLIGLSNKMMFGTEYKEVPPSDFYVMRGPPDTAWIADAVVEGMRTLLPGSLDKKMNVQQPMGAPDWYDPTLWQLAGRWSQSALGLDVPLLSAYKEAGQAGGQVSAADRERDTNYIGARTQDIMTGVLGMLGTGIGESVNTYAATGDLGKAVRQFDTTLGITKATAASNVSDVPLLYDAPTRYTRSNTLMSAVRETEQYAKSASDFLTQINNKQGNRIPIHISQNDLSTLKLMADTIHNTIEKNGQYKQYDKAFDSYAQAARLLDSVKGRRDFEPEQRVNMTQKLNRYAHRAAEIKIAILSKLKDQLVDQYGDYFSSKGIDPSTVDWPVINRLFNDALNRR